MWEQGKESGRNTGRFSRKSQKQLMKAWMRPAFPCLFPVMEKRSVHPADGWLICTGGLLVAKTGYGVVEIRNSRDQNCQHGFQRFIFSMLSAAWYSLPVFFCQKPSYSTPFYNGSKMFWAIRCLLRISEFPQGRGWNELLCVYREWNDWGSTPGVKTSQATCIKFCATLMAPRLEIERSSVTRFNAAS